MAPKMIITAQDLKIRFPMRLILVGSSGGGKTFFCLQLIRYSNDMFTANPDRIIFFYSIMQKEMEDLGKQDKRIQFIHESEFNCDIYLEKPKDEKLLLILDDMMSNNIYEDLSNLFCKYSRHLNIGVVFMTQNPFHRGAANSIRFNRDILANSNEIVLFRSPRLVKKSVHDRFKKVFIIFSIFSIFFSLFFLSFFRETVAAFSIGKAAFGPRFQYFKASYLEATQDRFSYLYCSFDHMTKPELMLRSTIFFPIEHVHLYFDKLDKK